MANVPPEYEPIIKRVEEELAKTASDKTKPNIVRLFLDMLLSKLP